MASSGSIRSCLVRRTIAIHPPVPSHFAPSGRSTSPPYPEMACGKASPGWWITSKRTCGWCSRPPSPAPGLCCAAHRNLPVAPAHPPALPIRPHRMHSLIDCPTNPPNYPHRVVSFHLNQAES
eukprot:EG_transcript_18663